MSSAREPAKSRSPPMSVKQKVRTQLRKLGYDIARFDPESHPLARRGRLLRSLQIDVVLDVGANAGQYAQELRDLGSPAASARSSR